MKPRYIHDCSKCVFLETYEDYDLYVCARHGKIDTLIARYGSNENKYISGLVFAISQECKALSIALTLAEKGGFSYET